MAGTPMLALGTSKSQRCADFKASAAHYAGYARTRGCIGARVEPGGLQLAVNKPSMALL